MLNAHRDANKKDANAALDVLPSDGRGRSKDVRIRTYLSGASC